MIKNLSELLSEFVKTEVEVLNEKDIKHPTTIGAMYEGLTKEVLDRSIFEGLNLRVVKNSFILGCDTEFDILLVEGEGEQIPYTDRYQYRPEQVIVVIQVKKNLYGKDIKQGFENLQFLIDYFEPKELLPFVGRLFRDSFRAICRKGVEAKSSGELTAQEDVLFHTLGIEAFLPPRIIWGYNGFASEYNFRQSFVDYLGDNVTKDLENIKGGFGPHNFPSLIICGPYSMIKNNAMPFTSPVEEDGWWPFYTTSSSNPTNLFLEVVWTRLSYMYEQLGMEIFGEDLDQEPHTRFLSCRLKELEGRAGWEYDYYVASEETLKANIQAGTWEPSFINETQHVIMTELCKKSEIDLAADKELESFVLTGPYKSLSEFLQSLMDKGLVYVADNKLRLLTDNCLCGILPDGRMFAGENKSGRMHRWSIKESRKIIAAKSAGQSS